MQCRATGVEVRSRTEQHAGKPPRTVDRTVDRRPRSPAPLDKNPNSWRLGGSSAVKNLPLTHETLGLYYKINKKEEKGREKRKEKGKSKRRRRIGTSRAGSTGTSL